MLKLLFLIAAYLTGAIPFGVLIGKMYGVDVRKAGSCNIGATNVTRTVGKTAGKVCFLLDFLKGALPLVLIQLVFPEDPLLPLLAGFAAIFGHMFPVYLRFKGGKGVSTAAGAALALAPLPLFAALAVWVIIFFVSRYVSLASITAAAALPVMALLFSHLGWGSQAARSGWTIVFFVLIAALAILRHHANIRRLLNGAESRFSKKK